MTVDLTERAPAPLTDGPLWEALVAATALAGMFPPYERGGHRLVDGLALVPVPTAAVQDGGRRHHRLGEPDGARDAARLAR